MVIFQLNIKKKKTCEYQSAWEWSWKYIFDDVLHLKLINQFISSYKPVSSKKFAKYGTVALNESWWCYKKNKDKELVGGDTNYADACPAVCVN